MREQDAFLLTRSISEIQMRRRLPTILSIQTTLATVLWCSPPTALGGDERHSTAELPYTKFEWDPVRGTQYYLGTIASPLGPSRVRTSGLWVIVPESHSLTLDAVDFQGRRRPVKVRIVALPKPEPVPPQTTPEEEKPISPDELFLGFEKGAEAYGDDVRSGSDSTPTDGPTPQDSSSQETYFEPSFSKPERKSSTQDPSIASSSGADSLFDPFKRGISVTLGIGTEKLSARGGAGEFDGNANIGGMGLSFESRIPTTPWFVVSRFSAHNFATTTVHEDAQAGTEEEDIARYLRTSVAAMGYYDLLRKSPEYGRDSIFGVGLGLAYHRLPVLQLLDSTSGKTELRLRAGLAPAVGLYGAKNLTTEHTVGAMLSTLMESLSISSKAKGLNALAFWRYDFDQAFYTDFSWATQSETIKHTQSCPANSDCDEQSQSTSQISVFKLGLGVHF